MYKSIRDEDTLVVVQALLVLDRALAQEGGVVVNRKLAQYLLLRLPHFQPPQLATVLQVLRKYTPKTDPELFTQLSKNLDADIFRMGLELTGIFPMNAHQ